MKYLVIILSIAIIQNVQMSLQLETTTNTKHKVVSSSDTNFPEVEYPTSVLDNIPFYYKSSDILLDEFPEDVKSSFKAMTDASESKAPLSQSKGDNVKSPPNKPPNAENKPIHKESNNNASVSQNSSKNINESNTTLDSTGRNWTTIATNEQNNKNRTNQIDTIKEARNNSNNLKHEGSNNCNNVTSGNATIASSSLNKIDNIKNDTVSNKQISVNNNTDTVISGVTDNKCNKSSQFQNKETLNQTEDENNRLSGRNSTTLLNDISKNKSSEKVVNETESEIKKIIENLGDVSNQNATNFRNFPVNGTKTEGTTVESTSSIPKNEISSKPEYESQVEKPMLLKETEKDVQDAE